MSDFERVRRYYENNIIRLAFQFDIKGNLEERPAHVFVHFDGQFPSGLVESTIGL